MPQKRRKKRKKKSPLAPIIFATMVVALIAGGIIAWVATRPDTGEDQASVCALVVDRTSSSMSAEITDKYRTLAEKTIDGCRDRRAKLSIFYFDESTDKLAQQGEVFNLWIPKGPKEGSQKVELKSTVKAAKQSASKVFDQASKGAQGSDILTAVNGAVENIRTQALGDGVSESYLVVLTDGLQISTDITVASFTEESVPVEPLVDRAASLGLVSDALGGVKVSFAGVGGGLRTDTGQLPQWFEAHVEAFWRQIVTRGGGSVCAYVPDAQELPITVGC